MTALRIAFFGTPAFAVPTLGALTRSGHTVVGVVTRPDRPRGRGQHVVDSPVKAFAAKAGLPTLQPPRLEDAEFVRALSAWRVDLGVVAAYGKILTDEVLAIPRLGMINVHASLLPRYRGAAPVHRAVMAGDAETGVTIMRVVKALDAGPMLATARRPIGPDETSEEVERDLARLGAEQLVAVADALSVGPVAEHPQNDAEATYARRLVKDDGAIEWSRGATAIHNQVRGLFPWPHAYTFHGARRLIIWRTAVNASDARVGASALPGTIVAATGDDLLVRAGDAAVRVVELQTEGKRPMPVRQFLAGHALAVGSRLHRQ